MSSQPRVACIGAGLWGRNLIRNFEALGALGAVVDTSARARTEMERAYPGTPVLPNTPLALRDAAVDAVAIASPAESHGELVRAALMAGKHVFVEKPLCMSVPEAERLVALAAEQSRVLMVGHVLWYHPAITKLKELVDSGELGRINYIYSNRLNLGRIRREENILWSFAPHDVSVILGLLGEMPDRVSAQGGNYLHEQIADVTVSFLAFPSGARAHIFVSWLHPFKEQKLVVVGDRQMAVFDDREPVDKLVLYPHSIAWRNHVPVPNRADGWPVPLEAVEPLREECMHFLDCVQDGRTPRTDGAEALRVLRVLRTCQERLDDTRDRSVFDTQPPGPHYFKHESSYVDEGADIGDGTTIWHFSHVLPGSTIGHDCRIGQNVVIGPNVRVGNGVKIQNNVSVYEGVTLEDYVFCGPSVVFTNVYNPRSEIRRMDELRPTLVRRGASLGANCTVVCGVTIGEYAFIGAGAVVLQDVPDYAVVVGNPGQLVGWMCVCGQRIVFDGEEGVCSCERQYQKADSQVRMLERVALIAE